MPIRKRLTPAQSSLISSIEIAYFRSFYKVNFPDVGALNVFFGENDAGKSNVMRALSLFFNNTVGDEYAFDFDIDFSSRRLTEAKKGRDVRKFVYVKIGFRAPANHRDALGAEFFVKKTWSQLRGEDPSLEFSSHIDKPGKQQSLTKFLNKIVFTYIPAVKARGVYEDLLRESYNAIAQSALFAEALSAFTDKIREQTSGLAERLSSSLGMSSALSPPTDLGELFASLDFETLVGTGERMSLLRQRGDGVQARHIPEILSFISDEDKSRLYIWGIEEPENSLSMNSSVLLADRLKQIAEDRHIQIFLTTHSPAFYSASGAGIKKYFIKSVDLGVEVLDGSSASTASLMDFMGDKFFVPIIAESLREATQRAETIEREVESLRRKVNTSARPLLFVEGDTEEELFNHIFTVKDPLWKDKLELANLGGTSHAERLGTLTEGILQKLLQGRRGYILLDSDKAGRSALPKAITFADARTSWVKSPNNIWWRTLTPTDEALAAFKSAGLGSDDIAGICLEDCFSAAIRSRATSEAAYALGQPREFMHKADLFIVSNVLNDDVSQYYLRKPDPGYKKAFVKWLINNGLASCSALDKLADDLFSRLTVASHPPGGLA